MLARFFQMTKKVIDSFRVYKYQQINEIGLNLVVIFKKNSRMSIYKIPVFIFCMILLSNCAQEEQEQKVISKELHQTNKLHLFTLLI